MHVDFDLEVMFEFTTIRSFAVFINNKYGQKNSQKDNLDKSSKIEEAKHRLSNRLKTKSTFI